MDDDTTPPGGDKPSDPRSLTTLPPAPEENAEQLAVAELKELAIAGFNSWREVAALQQQDNQHAREHQLRMAELRFGFDERENNAERVLESRRETRDAAFVGGFVLLLLLTAILLLFSGLRDIGIEVLKTLLTLAAGVGLAQAAPIRRIFDQRSKTKADEDEQR